MRNSSIGFRGFRLTHLYYRDDRSQLKEWRTFQNKEGSSPTTSFRRHLRDHHPVHWEHECKRLSIPFKRQKKGAPQESTLDAPGIEPFTKDGLLKRLVKFVTNGDQVRSI